MALLCHSGHKQFSLAHQFFRHRMIQFQEKVILIGNFGQPILASKEQCRVKLLLGKTIKSFGRKTLPIWSPTDQSLVASDLSLAAFDDPLQHSQVFSKPGP